MTSITRRRLFAEAGAALSASALSLALVPIVTAEEVCGRPLDPAVRFEAARAEFKAAAQAIYPDINDWNDRATEHGVVMIGLCPPRPVQFDGCGVYEIKVGKTAPIVALAASESGAGYYWQHYWCKDGVDRFDGKVRSIKSANLIIKRKIKAFA